VLNIIAIIDLIFGIILINYGLAEQIRKAIIKVWSTFSKVVGVGKAHKYFPLCNLTIAKQLAVGRHEHNGESP